MKKILILLCLLLIVLLTLGCSKKDDLKYLSYGDFKVLYPQSSKIIEFSKTDLEMIFPSSEAYIQIDFSNGCIEAIKRKRNFEEHVKDAERWMDLSSTIMKNRVVGENEAYYVYQNSFTNEGYHPHYTDGFAVLRLINCDGKGYSIEVTCSPEIYEKDKEYMKKIVYSAICN